MALFCCIFVLYSCIFVHKRSLNIWAQALLFFSASLNLRGGLAQLLASQTTDQGVPGSRPGQVAVRCGLEQVTFIPCLVLVKPRKPWTYD